MSDTHVSDRETERDKRRRHGRRRRPGWGSPCTWWATGGHPDRDWGALIKEQGPHTAQLARHGQKKAREGSTSPQGAFVRPEEDQAGRKRRNGGLPSGGLGRRSSPRRTARGGPAHPSPGAV